MSGDDAPSASDDESSELAQYLMDIAGSAGSVVLVGMLLFAVSGVWPPLVAIESASMEPHIDKGDLVFVMEEERFSGENAKHGVVTARQASSYDRFQQPGDVIVYEPNGSDRRTPIIHRAMFYVEKDEDWYSRADPDAIGDADNCSELANCPAPHDGFITKGDNERSNRNYDQVGNAISPPVKPEWVVGTAEYRVPLLGEIRLRV